MRQMYWAFRFFVLMIAGVVAAITSNNPLYLGITVAAFIGLALYVWRQGYVYEPKWEPLVAQGKDQGTKGDWPQALVSFDTAMRKCRNPRERREASEQISTYLLANNHTFDAEPYLRRAVDLTTSVFGSTHPRSAALRAQLSDLYLKTGQTWLAAEVQGRAVAAATARNPTALGAADAEARYAEILLKSGDSTAAAAQYQQALQIIESTKADAPALIPALVSASRYAARSGDHAKAEQLLRRASRCMNQDTPRKIVEEVLSGLVDVLVAQERYADAAKAVQLRLQGPTPEPAEGARIRRQLADLLERAGSPEEAARQRRLAQTLQAMASPRTTA